MHELSVTQSIVNICCEEAEKNGAKKVNEIKIKVGELSGLVPECIQSYFDFISSGTVVEGAKLNIERIPIGIKCRDCGKENILDYKICSCPNCGSFNVKIISGNEFYIDCLEVE